MKKNKKTSFNLEEKEILSSFEKDEWKTVKRVKKEKLRAQKTATKTFHKYAYLTSLISK